MERVKRKLGDGVPMALVFPVSETVEQPPAPTATAAPAEIESQPRLAVRHSLADPVSRAEPNLGPIIECADEQASLCERSTPKQDAPAVRDVDIDLDKKFRDLVEGVRRRTSRV